MSCAAPVFIVGAPRSGTTLLTAILGSHPAFDSGPETGFFQHLANGRFRVALTTDAWPDTALAALDNLPDAAGRSLTERYGITRDDVHTYLANNERSPSTLLRAIADVSATRRERRRWIEKTPLHLLHVDDILTHFPDARIVRIVRDPRDAANSMRKLPSESRSLAANCYAWMHYHALSRDSFTAQPRTLTLRYEDLLADTEPVLETVCDFVGETLHPAMLDLGSRSSRVQADGEPWKDDVTRRLDPSGAFRWKRDLDPDTLALTSLVCHEALVEFGYETQKAPKANLSVRPLDRVFLEQNERLLMELAQRGRRITPTVFSASPRIDTVGLDREDMVGAVPLPLGAWPRVRECARLATCLLARRLSGAPARYLAGSTWGPGQAERLAGALVRSLGRSVDT